MRFLGILLGLVLLVGLMVGLSATAFASEPPTFSGGTGKQNDPYMISTEEDLRALARSVNDGNDYDGYFFKLTKSIDLTGDWTPIGQGAAEGAINGNDGSPVVGDDWKPFKGTLDGGDKWGGKYYIGNLKIAAGSNKGIGLFGAIDGATIKNLKFQDVTITGSGDFVGALAGYAYNSTIEKVDVSFKININGRHFVGGAVGYASNTSFENVRMNNSYGTITASDDDTGEYGDDVGGLVGYTVGGTELNNCQVTAGSNGITVVGTRQAGGLVGLLSAGSTVTGCQVSNVTVQAATTQKVANTKGVKKLNFGGLAGAMHSGSVSVNNNQIKVTKLTLDSSAEELKANIRMGKVTGGTYGADTFAVTNTSQTGDGNIVTNVTKPDGIKAVDYLHELIDGTEGAIARVGAESDNLQFTNLDDAVAKAIATSKDIYLLVDCRGLSIKKLNVNQETTFTVRGNNNFGADFAAKTDIADGPWVNSWTIANAGKNAIYTYTIDKATVSIERPGSPVYYPTALYHAFVAPEPAAADSGDTVKILENINWDAEKEIVPVYKSNITIDLNGKTITLANPDHIKLGYNFVDTEVDDPLTLTMKNGYINGDGAIMVGKKSTLVLDNASVARISALPGAKIVCKTGNEVTAENIAAADSEEIQKVTFNHNYSGAVPAAVIQVLKKSTETALLSMDELGYKQENYVFNGWNTEQDGSGTSYTDAQKVNLTEDLVLYAQWARVATAPAISEITSLTGDHALIYGYTSGSIAVTAKAATDTTYDLSYQWYSNTTSSNTNGTAIASATGASYTIPTGKSAGTTEYYYCVVTATRKDNGQTATATSPVATVTVNKADPTATAPTATATYGQTLADVTLTNPTGNTPGAWAWTDATTTNVGNPGDHTFKASFTPTDTANYNSKTDVDVVVTVAKATPTVTAPTAKTLTWTGEAQELVTAGSTNGGELQYSLDGTNYSTTIPKGTEAGNYTVYFKVVGDDNYADTPAASFTVTIADADAGNTKPGAADKLTYTGEAQKLVTGGSVTGGELRYVLGTDASTAPALDSFTKDVPTGTNAGTYYVWYRVKGDANHNDVAPACIEVKIAKAAIKPEVSITGWTYGEKANAPAVTGNTDNGAVTYTYSDKADGTFTATVPANAGTWYVKASVAETDNYLGGEATLSFAIAKATLTVVAVNQSKVEGEADPQLTYTVTGLVGSDTLTGTLARQPGEDAGTYDITQGTLAASDNYNISFTKGRLTITAKPLSGHVEVGTITGPGVPPMNVAGMTDEFAKKTLTPTELVMMDNGANARVYVEATNTDGSISDTMKQQILHTLPSGAKIATTMDVSMYKQVGDNLPVKVSGLPAPVTLEFDVSRYGSRTAGMQHTIFVMHYMNGAWRVEGQGAGPTITVQVNELSPFAIAYVDTPIATPEPTAKPTKAPKPTAEPTAKPTKAPKPTVKPTKAPKPTVKPTTKPTVKPEPKPVKADYTLLAKMTVCGSSKTSLEVSWTKVKEADGYDVFFAKCGKNYKLKGSIHGTSVRFTKLSKRAGYKAYVRAWKLEGSGKVYIGKASPEVHAITGGYNAKSCNARDVRLNRSSLKLKVGKSKTIKATVKGVKSGRKLLDHVRLVRWYSSNANVATVNKNGKVKAVGKGSCTVWAIANNGVRTSVKVTVK